MDINEPTEASVDVETTKVESTFKDNDNLYPTLTEIGENNVESMLDVPSNTSENHSLKDGLVNGCNDSPRSEEEDILNGIVNEVADTPLSNHGIDNKENIQTGVVNEESVEAGVDNEESIAVGVDNEEVANEEGSITNADNKVVDSKTDCSVFMDVEDKKYEMSMQNVANIDNFDANRTIYRSSNIDDEVTSDSESDSSTSLSSSSSSEDEAPMKPNVKEKPPEEEKNIEKPRVKGELRIEDLPPIEELKITADEKVELTCVGSISSILERLVVIQSLESESSPLNDDSILFLEDRTAIGQVFEIFGPVRCPLYSVRFNTSQYIKEKGLKVGMKIYYAPKEMQYTNYVFVQDLMKQKGSDASWEHDLEPPVKFLDYSDDEKERLMKKNKKKSYDDNSESDNDSSKEEKNQARRKKNSNNPFYLRNKSSVSHKNNKNYKQKYDGASQQGHQNEPEYNPQHFDHWHSNTYISWPLKGPGNQPFDDPSNRSLNTFDNRPPNPNNWPRNPSNNWSTNPPNLWPSKPANSWRQTGTNNWVSNPPNNWSSTNGPNKWPTNTPNSWFQNTPNNWSSNTSSNWFPNDPNSSFQNSPSNLTQNTANNWSEPNSWTQNNPNSWTQNNPNSWSQNNPNSWSQNTPNISAQNIPHSSSQMNPNVWSSNWPINWPPNPNNLPPNPFSIPPPNTSNSISRSSTNLPNNPPPNAPNWTQDSQLSYAQIKGYPPSSNQWPPQHANSTNTWNNKPNFNS